MKPTLKHRFFSGILFVFLAAALNILIMSIMAITWYQNQLYHTVDILQPILNNFVITATFGAILGFITTKSNKKSEKIDFIILFIIQCIFSSYAIYQLWMTRPAYIVYDVIDFYIIKQNEIITDNHSIPVQWSYFKPTYAAIRLAIDNEEKSQRIYQQYHTGIFTAQRAQLYTPLDERYTSTLDTIIKNTKNNKQISTNSCFQQIDNYQNFTFFITSSLNAHEKGNFFVAIQKNNGKYQVHHLIYCH